MNLMPAYLKFYPFRFQMSAAVDIIAFRQQSAILKNNRG